VKKKLTPLHLVKHPEPHGSTPSEYVIRIEQVPAVRAPDALVAFPYTLEAAAARKVERDGHLKVARIGRRKYARLSELLALVDKLAASPRVDASGDAEANYAALVGRTGGGR
jgi:hypothetical protein